ncbi:carbonic anhydrase [Chytriomyces sp. MP71]|nr:carbonic anhydrase [Chytriomyces sp. MP71]
MYQGELVEVLSLVITTYNVTLHTATTELPPLPVQRSLTASRIEVELDALQNLSNDVASALSQPSNIIATKSKSSKPGSKAASRIASKAPSPSRSKPASRSISRQTSQSKIQTTQPTRELREPATERADTSGPPEHAATYGTLPQPSEQEARTAPGLEPSQLILERYEPTPPPGIAAPRHRPVAARKKTLKDPEVEPSHDEQPVHVIFESEPRTVILDDAGREAEKQEEQEGVGNVPLRDSDAKSPSELRRIQDVTNELSTSEPGLTKAQSIMETVYSSQYSLASGSRPVSRAPSASVRRSLESAGAKGLRLDRVMSPTMALNKLPKTGSLGSVKPEVVKKNPQVSSFLNGFRRFQKTYFGDNSELYNTLKNGQSPKTLLIGCCDSRVDPAIITDCEPGDMFVVRNVANLVAPYKTDGGQRGCRRIAALMRGITDTEETEFLGPWMKIAEKARAKVIKLGYPNRACEHASILLSLENLVSYPWIKERLLSNSISIHGWYFDFEDGELLALNPDTLVFEPLVEAEEE